MSKNLTALFKQIISGKPKTPDLKEALGNDVACYVLIYCTNPDRRGKIQVDLIYEGDRKTAAYLLESAQGSLD